MSDKVVKGFAFLGLISIVALSLYYIVKGLQKLQYDKTYTEVKIPTWPPYNYMQNIGSVCPTGWTIGDEITEEDDDNIGKIKCSHSDYSYNNNDYYPFTPIADWKDCITKYSSNSDDCPALQERCNFLTNKDINKYNNSSNSSSYNTRVPWIGVSNLCN